MARTCEDELKIAVIGDVHLHWSAADTAWFDSSDYNLLLFVGDIGSYRHSETLRVARSIGELSKPAILVAGNHDGPSLVQQASEIFGQGHLSDWLDGRQQRRMEQLTTAFSGVQVAGYERCPLGSDIDLIVCRPHSMGGGRLHFAQALRTRYGVSSLAESKERLCSLVDGSSASRLVFLGHNGPTGLGSRREDIWGCDFRRDEGDQGDPDLAAAVRHARSLGKKVQAVVAGHMHRRLKGGGERRWMLERDGTLYLNAARVPRVFQRDDIQLRHHVELRLTPSSVFAGDVFVTAQGERSEVVSC